MSTPSPSTATTIHQVSRLTITLDEGYEAFRRRYDEAVPVLPRDEMPAHSGSWADMIAWFDEIAPFGLVCYFRIEVDDAMGLAGHTIYSDFELACEQAPLELFGTRIDDRKFNARIPRLNGCDQLDQLTWRNRAHDAQPQYRLFHLREVFRDTLGLPHLVMHRLQVRPHHLSEFGQMCVCALAVEQRAA